MKLHSTTIGEGKPLLILHGFLGMSDNWKTLGGQFAEVGYQVHLIDQRNHGRSPHSNEMSYLEMAKDLKQYIEDHSLDQVVLLGHSMGGKTAMFVAAYFPQLLEKLIVVDIAPKYYRPHHRDILAGLQAVDQTELTSRNQADEVLSEYVKEQAVRMFLLKNLYWKEKGKLALRLNLEVLVNAGETIGEELPDSKSYEGPSLFIRGGNSNYIKSADEGLISRQFPDSEIITIADAGHWVHAEKRDEFYQVVMDFLE